MAHRSYTSRLIILAVAVVAACILIPAFLLRQERNKDLGSDGKARSKPPDGKLETVGQPPAGVAQVSATKANPAWAPRFEELKNALSGAAARGDLDGVKAIAKRLQQEAPISDQPMVQLLISQTYKGITDRRKQELHAPRDQTLSTVDARQLLDRLRGEQDPTKRTDTLRALLASRLPEELLPDVRHVIGQALALNPPDSLCLNLLNSFAGSSGMSALYEFAGPPYPKEVRERAVRLMGERSWSSEDMDRILLLLKSEADPDLKAAWLMGLSAKGGTAVEAAALFGLSDPSPKVRAAATLGLDAKREDHRELLLKTLSDSEASVRLRGIGQLARNVADAKVLSAVLYSAESDTSSAVRQGAVRILLQDQFKSNSEVLSTLRRLAGADPSDDVRLLASNVLRGLEGRR